MGWVGMRKCHEVILHKFIKQTSVAIKIISRLRSDFVFTNENLRFRNRFYEHIFQCGQQLRVHSHLRLVDRVPTFPD